MDEITFKFQSHAGSIEAHHSFVLCSCQLLCFNPTLVRLRRALVVAYRHLPRVSIPRWFD